jgi:hypothetical protein
VYELLFHTFFPFKQIKSFGNIDRAKLATIIVYIDGMPYVTITLLSCLCDRLAPFSMLIPNNGNVKQRKTERMKLKTSGHREPCV